MFSLAALTERSPSCVPAPRHASPEPDSIDLGEVARARTFTADVGPALYPLGGPQADRAGFDPNPGRRATLVVPLALVVGALLVAAGIIATAVWSVQTPTPPPPALAPEPTLPQIDTQPARVPEPETEAPRAGGALAEPAASSAASSGSSSSRRQQRSRPGPPAARPEPTRVPAGPCAHCPPQDLACNIKCRAG